MCFNFDRWYNWTGLAASEAFGYYYNKLFKGYASNPEDAVYKSCAPDGDNKVTIELNKPFAGFVAVAVAAVVRDAEPVGARRSSALTRSAAPPRPRSSPSTPWGTRSAPAPTSSTSGPRASSSPSRPTATTGVRQGQVDEIIFRTIDDPTARRQALESGSIDGYDLVGPADTKALEDDGFTMVSRPPFTILYLAFNQAVPELQDPKVREAISYAIDKDALISQVLPEGTEKAIEFMPPVVNGYNADVTTYDFDPEKAKSLLAEAGYTEANPLKLDFNYPVNVSRPYMPDPEQIFTVLSSQLADVGVETTPVSEEWVEYLDRTTGTSDHGIHLLGWTGDYNDTDNFVGVFFGQQGSEWGFDNPELFQELTEARGSPDLEEQTALYEEINEDVAQFIPGVPLAHPAPTLAFDPRVKSYPASPVNDEVFTDIVLTK